MQEIVMPCLLHSNLEIASLRKVAKWTRTTQRYSQWSTPSCDAPGLMSSNSYVMLHHFLQINATTYIKMLVMVVKTWTKVVLFQKTSTPSYMANATHEWLIKNLSQLCNPNMCHLIFPDINSLDNFVWDFNEIETTIPKTCRCICEENLLISFYLISLLYYYNYYLFSINWHTLYAMFSRILIKK